MGKEVMDDDLGLKIVRPVKNPSIDIVAVHGIGAHPDRTWTMENREGEWVNWLTDPSMLPQKLPYARIMRFGYKSEWFGSEKVETKKTLVQDVAKALLKGLEHCRDDPTRPLLFVAHSFGGHVVMYALRHSFEHPDEWLNPFASTAGLVFLGTPFRGRQGMQLSDMIRRIKEAHPDYQIWQETMDMSVPDNPFLLETVHRFLETRVDKRFIPICCFYETLPSPLGKVLQSNDTGKAAEKDYLVPEGSACLDNSIGIHRHPLDRHHYNLNKFCQDSDQSYKSVEDCIRKMASEAMNFLKECSKAQTLYKTNFSLAGVPVVETFIDRPLEMKALESKLLPKPGSRRKVFALHGLGGIGKTQLAAEFARRFCHHFSSVFWLHGETEDSLMRSLAACAGRIPKGQISEANRTLREPDDARVVAKEIKIWLSQKSNSDWLIIVDNFDKEYKPNSIPDFITEYISEADHGSIFFTTRLASLSELGPLLELGKLDRHQAQKILQSWLGRKYEHVKYDEILNRLDGLPLAISQAGAFLKESRMKVVDYIRCYDVQFSSLMKSEADDGLLYYHGNVWTTWIISYNEIRSKNKSGEAAANLLLLWSCINSRDLWFGLFREGYKQGEFPSWMDEIASSSLRFSKALRLLRRYSMVEEAEEDGSHSTHPVVHKWVYHYNYSTICKTIGPIALALMRNVNQTLHKFEEAWRFLPHFQSFFESLLLEERRQVYESRDYGELEQDNVSELPFRSAQKELLEGSDIFFLMDKAFDLGEQDLHLFEDKSGSDDPSMIDANLSLSRRYRERNRLEEATRMGERALEGLRESCDSISKLMAMSFLGQLYLFQGRISDAREIMRDAWVEWIPTTHGSDGLINVSLFLFELTFIHATLCLEEDEYDKATAVMKELTQQRDAEDPEPLAELRLLALHRLGILYMISTEQIELDNLRFIVPIHSKKASHLLRSTAISSLLQRFHSEWSDVGKKKLVDAWNAYEKARQASELRRFGDFVGDGLPNHFLVCSGNMMRTSQEWRQTFLFSMKQVGHSVLARMVGK